MTDARVGAVDIGTNSVRLLIVDAGGREIVRPMRITRLGQGVDVSGRLASDAIERTTHVLAEYRELLQRHGVERVRATATSAARDAANSGEFFDAAELALGTRPELLSGEEEARLSFTGACADLRSEQGPFLVIDLGGGSTELVLGTTQPEASVSLQLGCVRMTERHLHADPPTLEQIDACVADVQAELARLPANMDVTRVRQAIGLAGTVSALSAMQLGLERYDATRTHHARLSRPQVELLLGKLSAASLAQRRNLLVEPQRAEVIVGGAVVLLALMRELGITELLVSEHDILDGLAASVR